MIDFKTVISRSSYSRGIRCTKSLWLHRNREESSRNLPSDSKLIKLTSNQLVESAKALFKAEPYSCSRLKLEEDKDWNASVKATTEAINDGEKLLANPSFYANDLMCDIHYLEQKKSGNWIAYVVKSSTKISDKSIEKAAFQLHAIQEAGLKIVQFKFLTIDNSYKRAGEIDFFKLFKSRDILPKLKPLLPALEAHIPILRKTLLLNEPPKVAIGEYCLSPYNCEFKKNCWKHVPSSSVFELRKVSRETKFKWWNNGVKTIQDLKTSKYQSGIQLTEDQGKKNIDHDALREFLSQINYPILFLDFEGYLPALPPFDGVKPFQIIPFLYAAYKSESELKGTSFHHYIGSPGVDFRKQFAEKLIELCAPVESILVYDPLTEKKVIKSLIKTYPEFKSELESILLKIVDLAKPITNKHFYLPEMKGLSSMKYVLPAVTENTDYSNLSVQSGRAASQLFQILCDENHERNTETELQNLVEYCKMDVHGLVQVYNAFLKAVNRPTLKD